MKYKVGDKVKIREDLQTNKDYNNCTCVEEMEEYKGVVATITKCFGTDIDDDGAYEIDLDDGEWFWTDDMFENCGEKANMPMTVADLLNKTNVEVGGLIITVHYPNAYFEATIGHNKINRNSELYKRFIKAYGDMIVDEISFDIRNDNMVVMLIKVDYAD